MLNLIRETRGGKLYDAEFGKRMKGSGVYADLLRQRFNRAVARLGLNNRDKETLDCSLFTPPPKDPISCGSCEVSTAAQWIMLARSSALS